jgi:hypothetical protein
MTAPILVLTSLRERDPFQFRADALPWGHTFNFVYLDEPLELEVVGRTVRVIQAQTSINVALADLAGVIFLPASFDRIFSSWAEVAPADELLRRLHWNVLTSLFVLVGTLRCLNKPQSAIAAANKISLHTLLPDCTIPSVFSLSRQRVSASLKSPYLFKSANDTSEIDGHSRLAPCIFYHVPEITDERPVGLWQSFLAGEQELRCYYFDGDVISFEVPLGNVAEPDARYTDREVYNVKEVQDLAAADLVRRACSRLCLNFAALDVLKIDGGEYIILDINPHGSWDWLPMVAAERIRLRFNKLISDFFEAVRRK